MEKWFHGQSLRSHLYLERISYHFLKLSDQFQSCYDHFQATESEKSMQYLQKIENCLYVAGNW